MKLRIMGAIALAMTVVAPAMAAPVCGVDTFKKYGETRAFFQDVWAGCTPAGVCQFSSSEHDSAAPLKFRSELRFVLTKGSDKLALQLTSVFDQVALDKPIALSYGKTKTDLSGALETRENVVNQFHVKDAAKADEIGRAIVTTGKTVKWTYRDTYGEAHTATLPLRGADKALEWITCMAKG